MENARCILEDSGLGKEFWGHAVLTAAHIHNRLPSRSYNNLSPLEHWTGKLSKIGHLRIFGSTTWVHVPSERRQKVDPKSVRCVLVGYEEDTGSRVYQLYDPIIKRIICSRDVIIDEASIMAKAPAKTDKTIVKWEEEAPLAVSESREPTPDYFKPLDGIVPPLAPTEQPTGIHDSITVRPLSVRQNIVQGKKPQLPKKPPVNPSEPQRSRGTRDTGGIFSPQAQFALLAGQEEEPQTLTDALASD